MSLAVLDAGWASRVVDAGRPNFRRLGLPVGGAADRAALAIGNALVGNDSAAAALEICMRGPRLRALDDTGCVVFGAPFTITGPQSTHVAGTTFTLRAGEEVHIGGTPRGMRAYLCVRGGFRVRPIMGSRCALSCIRAGDTLVCAASVIGSRFVPAVAPRFRAEHRLRVLPGLQAGWTDADAPFGQDFAVGPNSDRMGLRLHGEPLPTPRRELVSEPVAPGAVQVTNDGQCIVLGVDGQTIGGYPKLAHVIQADLDWLGQIRPGETVRFVAVTSAEAVTLFRRQQAELVGWVLRIRAALDDANAALPSAGETEPQA